MNSIKIGPITYEVIIVDRLLGECDAKLDGRISHTRQNIEIESGLTVAMQRQTLWHEIVHGILTHAGRHDEVSEGAVDAIAYGVVGVINDNPDFVQSCQLK